MIYTKNEIDKIIKKYKNHEIINIFMVYKGLRKATLIEPIHFENNPKLKKIVYDLIDKLKLYKTYDISNRIMITKKKYKATFKLDNNEIIGKILGYYCYKNGLGGDVGISINTDIDNKTVNLWAEVCNTKDLNYKKLENHIKKVANKYHILLDKYPITYKIHIKVSNIDIKKNIINDNFKFIIDNEYDTRNYFENLLNISDWKGSTKIISVFDKKNIKLLKFLIKHEKDINYMFPGFDGTESNIKLIKYITHQLEYFVKHYNEKTNENDFKKLEMKIDKKYI